MYVPPFASDRPARRHPRAWPWLVSLLCWAAALLLLSLLPGDSLPSSLGVSDKLQHGAAYAVLTVLLAGVLMAGPGGSSRPLWHAGLGAFTYGLLLEVLQGLMPCGRTADWGDLLANALGVLCACALFRHTLRRCSKR